MCYKKYSQSQNLIMLQHLSDIARSKRVNDGNSKKMHWKDFYLQIVVNPRCVKVSPINKITLQINRLKTKGKVLPSPNEV